MLEKYTSQLPEKIKILQIGDLAAQIDNDSKGVTAGLPMSDKLGPRWNAVITRPDFKSEAIFGFLSPTYTGKSD